MMKKWRLSFGTHCEISFNFGAAVDEFQEPGCQWFNSWFLLAMPQTFRTMARLVENLAVMS